MSKKNSPVFRCVCCDAEMEPKKRYPVTTATGQMYSQHSDPIEKFPRDEWEDLCPKCIQSIRNTNADLSNLYGNQDKHLWTTPVRLDHSQDRMETECSELRLDVEFSYVNRMYEGCDE